MEDVRSGPSVGVIIGVVAAAVGLILLVGGTIVAVTIGRPALEARREAAERSEALEKEKQSAVEIVERTLQRYGYSKIRGDISLKKNDSQ